MPRHRRPYGFGVDLEPTSTDSRPWYVLGAMALPLLALSIDMNGVGTVLPSVQTDLAVEHGAIGWVVNATSLTFAATLITVGKIAPRLGNRRLVLMGVFGFALASVVCGTAPNLAVLVVGRIGQGLGGVLTFTTSLAVIDSVFDQRRRAAAIGAWGMVNGVGGAIGPIVGGAVTSWWSWRGFFFLNVPLCLVALPIIAKLAPADDTTSDKITLPWVKLATLSTGVVAVTAGFQNSASDGWTSPLTIVGLTGGAGLLGALLLYRRRGTEEIVTKSVRNSPMFRAASIVAFCSNWGFGITIVFIGFYLQTIRGLSPLEAGLVFCIFSTACAIAGLVIARLTHGLGLRRALAFGMVVTAIGLACGALVADQPLPLIFIAIVLGIEGLGQGLAFDLSTLAALEDVPENAAGEASAVISTVRSLGFTIGVAVSSTVMISVGGLGAGHTTAGLAAVLAIAAGVALIGLAGAFVETKRSASLVES